MYGVKVFSSRSENDNLSETEGVASKESVVNNIELETDRVVTIKIRCHMQMTDRAVFVSLC
jgi:hypothetical protein